MVSYSLEDADSENLGGNLRKQRVRESIVTEEGASCAEKGKPF